MSLKEILLGAGILGIGLPSTYLFWNYCPANNNDEYFVKLLSTLGIGFASVIAGGYLLGRGIREESSNRDREERR